MIIQAASSQRYAKLCNRPIQLRFERSPTLLSWSFWYFHITSFGRFSVFVKCAEDCCRAGVFHVFAVASVQKFIRSVRSGFVFLFCVLYQQIIDSGIDLLNYVFYLLKHPRYQCWFTIVLHRINQCCWGGGEEAGVRKLSLAKGDTYFSSKNLHQIQ